MWEVVRGVLDVAIDKFVELQADMTRAPVEVDVARVSGEPRAK